MINTLIFYVILENKKKKGLRNLWDLDAFSWALELPSVVKAFNSAVHQLPFR